MTKPQDTPVATDPSPQTRLRKPYEKPEVQVYGDLAQITQTVSGSKQQDGAGHPNMHFTS